MKALALLAVVVSAALLFTPLYYLAPVPGVALMLLLWLNRNPAIGFYLIIFMVPFASFRKIGPVNLPWVISLAVLAVLAIRFLKDKKLPAITNSNLWPFIGLYVIANVLSTIFADYPETARSNLLLLIAGYGFVFLGMACLTRDAFRIHVPNIVIWSVGLSAVLALFDVLFGWSLFSEAHLSGELNRSVGGSTDPNNFSVMILFALPLVVHRALYPGSSGERTLMLAIIPIMLMAIATTFSRSGFLAMLLCLVLLMVQYRSYMKPRVLGFVLLIGFSGLVATAVSMPDTFWERQLSLIRWEDNSLNRRASYLVVGREAAARNPLLGSGPGAFSDIYAESEISRRYTRRSSERSRRAHNTYLEVLVGTGFIGLALFVALNIRAYQNLRVSERAFTARGDPELANLTASIRTGFITLMLFLVTYSELYHKHMLLSLILAQAAMYFSMRESETRIETPEGMPTVASAR